jgi:hypothetical protein
MSEAVVAVAPGTSNETNLSAAAAVPRESAIAQKTVQAVSCNIIALLE